MWSVAHFLQETERADEASANAPLSFLHRLARDLVLIGCIVAYIVSVIVIWGVLFP